jgi:hypothetical protein
LETTVTEPNFSLRNPNDDLDGVKVRDKNTPHHIAVIWRQQEKEVIYWKRKGVSRIREEGG